MDLSFITLQNLLIWLFAWSVFGFIMMGEDKHLATSQEGVRHPSRISEWRLHEIALAGGFFGIILGAKAFHHKTKKSSFWGAVVVTILIWMLLLYFLVSEGLLKLYL